MVHPGVILQEKLDNSGMSRKELAIRTNVSEKHIWTVVNGEKNISVSFAQKLGYVFEDAHYWIGLQTEYDEEQERFRRENDISDEELEILKPLHEMIVHLIEKGYIHNDCSDSYKVIQLRKFLQISNLEFIPQITYNAAYRAQLSSNVMVNPYVLFAWQQLCEHETANICTYKELDTSRLESSIGRIRSLMFGSLNQGAEELQKILADCGIAFQVVKHFRGAPVQGFIKQLSSGRIIMCLTMRGKRADRFWFTLFHEIAHILNGDYNVRFVDFDSVKSDAEGLADQYARDVLIPPDAYRQFISSSDCTSWDKIEAFAEAIDVEPFIVLGRLQKDELVEWSDYADRIVMYDWA